MDAEKTFYTQEHTGLYVGCLTPEQHEKTCGYWYTVTSHATSHTAFRTQAGLFQWMQDCGLTLNGQLPPFKTWARLEILGSYRKTGHLDPTTFYGIAGNLRRQMDNGQVTLAIIGTDPDGIRNVHTLNCNIKTRPIFDPQISRAIMDVDLTPPPSHADCLRKKS